MPELPEVETVARGLAAVWEGRTLARITCRRPDLRKPLPPDFTRRLEGRIIQTVGRRAKYLVVRLESGLVMLGHLGMSGSMVISRGRNEPPGAHDHVEFVTTDGTTVTYRDPRRFGLLDLCDTDRLDSHPLLAGLGPEPLDDAFTDAVLSAALAGRHTPIKAALLDQAVVAGLGNIYVCEALFRAGISPRRLAASVAGTRATRLVPAIKAVLLESIGAGGSSLRDYVRADGEIGRFQDRFAVYGREGEPCPHCGTPVLRIVQSGRSTFYCPRRQR